MVLHRQVRRCSVDLHRLKPASPLARRCLSDCLAVGARSKSNLQWTLLKEKRPCKRRGGMTPGKIELQLEKTWRLEQTKEGSLPYFGSLVRWNERRHRKCPVIFPPFSVLLFTSFIFKTRWVTVKEVFLLLITNVTRLHWSSCQCRYLSNWLDDDVPCTPNGQLIRIQRKHDLFVFAALAIGFYL